MLVVSNLVLQACISFYSVSDRSGEWRICVLPCSHENTVARMVSRDGPATTATSEVIS